MERIFHERAKRVFTVHFALSIALCRPIQVREKEPRAVVAHHLVNLLDPLKDHLQLLSFCRRHDRRRISLRFFLEKVLRPE